MSSNLPQLPSLVVGEREFRRACAQFATGVAVATVLDESGAPHGMTVNSFTSVSLAPPLALICIAHSASVIDLFRRAGHFGISMLGEEQRALSERFAQRGRDRFDDVPWCPGDSGVPLIPDAPSHIEFRLVRTETAGDHDIFIGEAVRTVVRAGNPLIYYGSGYSRLER